VLDLPGQPVIDKHRLVGGCVRLPLEVDAGRLLQEVAALSPSLWGTSGGRGSVNYAAEAIFLRGYAPAEGNRPIEDRPALNELPYVRTIMSELGAPPLRCLLARMPPGSSISPHIDQAPYFSKSLRVHVPVETHENVWMHCAGATYQMKPGEVWMLNNVATHAVWNAHAVLSRTHLICDFLPTPALLDLLSRGERDLGRSVPHAERHFQELAAAYQAAAKR
jgi:Aspartyl/Asparaginyl beta-hydroxylase